MSTAIAVPYLAVHDGAAAIDWYVEAFNAVIGQRVTSSDGKLGHAEFTIDGAQFYLSDEFPEIGVKSPRTLGGSAIAIHLTVADVDARFSRAVDAGATSILAPADQPHGARHGTLIDPYGHRWMLSQNIGVVPHDEYARQMSEHGYTVTGAATASVASAARNGRIWPAVNAADAPALIRFLIDVLGFEENLVVPGADAATIIHSQLRWPDGGIVQVSSANREESIFSERGVGAQSIYLITSDPHAVYERCVAGGATVALSPIAPEYDPNGMVFTIVDAEGNLWSIGTYAGEA
ncbi:hypothetical protein K2X89_13835 [Myxococcota bacterium]|nr:hypothetical protein [Myxococcota bacterium]